MSHPHYEWFPVERVPGFPLIRPVGTLSPSGGVGMSRMTPPEMKTPRPQRAVGATKINP